MLIGIVLLLFSGISATPFRYDGYRLIQIIPKVENHIHLLAEWEHDPEFDIWNQMKGLDTNVDVFLSPNAFEKFKPLFDLNGFTYKVVDYNIQSKIDQEARSMKEFLLKNGEGKVTGTYARHGDINTWLDTKAQANPTYVSTYIAGKSLENRDMKVIKFKTATAQRKIWFDCGIHAREWISPSTCVWMIDKFIQDYNRGDATVKTILDKYEIHILPVHNPDGYEYSHSLIRLWRKNRRVNAGSTCYGADLNRNFGYQWMVSGASKDPCSETFAGPSADSEPEVQVVQNAINAYKDWDAFITIHSYGQWFLAPWSWTTQLPADFIEQDRVGKIAAAAIKAVNGTVYTVGSSANLLYLASGCSADWAYAKANIKYSYIIELRPAQYTVDASQYGFIYPVERVPAVGNEIYYGMLTLLTTI